MFLLTARVLRYYPVKAVTFFYTVAELVEAAFPMKETPPSTSSGSYIVAGRKFTIPEFRTNISWQSALALS